MKKLITVTAIIAVLALCLTACTPAATPTEEPSQAVTGQLSPQATATPGFVPTPDPTPEPKQRITVSQGTLLVDFEDLTKTAYYDLSEWGFAFPDKTAFWDDNTSGNAVRIGIDNEPTHGVVSFQVDDTQGMLTGGMQNAASYRYIRIYVRNVGDADLCLAMLPVINGKGKNTVLNPNGARMLDAYGEEVDVYPSDIAGINATNGTGDTHVVVPAGFEGWVYYPLEQHVLWWEKTDITMEEMTTVDHFNIDIRYADAYNCDYLVLDEICLANYED